MMMWQGLGDLINRFRTQILHLEEVSKIWAPGQLYRLKVPYTYMWSPSLIPKPKDWGPEIDISGFVFLDLASSFKPPPELQKFLDDGPPPVYIGFGSIVVDDPDAFTELIFEDASDIIKQPCCVFMELKESVMHLMNFTFFCLSSLQRKHNCYIDFRGFITASLNLFIQTIHPLQPEINH